MSCCYAKSNNSIFCFGWSFQTGAIAIGSVCMYAAAYTLLQGIEELDSIGILLFGMPFSILVSAGFASKIYQQIVIPILVIAVTIPLLIAATKNSRPKLLLPWLIVNIITILTMVAYGLKGSYFRLQQGWFGIIYLLSTLIISGISIFCWVVIVRYYKQLKEPLLTLSTVAYSSATKAVSQ